ncbi:MAG: hypothetical protein HY270_23635 [Deltaproteobacteria bacterium]|nr:hypothetical protein [Deltaproteobacteria bacterium]
MRSQAGRLPALLSFWLPGLGQIWRCQWLKGGVMLAVSFQSSSAAIDEAANICSPSASPSRLVLLLATATVVWLWAVVDARRAPGQSLEGAGDPRRR